MALMSPQQPAPKDTSLLKNLRSMVVDTQS